MSGPVDAGAPTGTPAVEAGRAAPVIRLRAPAADARFQRLLKVGTPAWVISSAVHAVVIAILIATIGLTQPPVDKASESAINTSLPNTDEVDVGAVTEAIVGDHTADLQAAGPPATSDPFDAVQGINDQPPFASGSANDAFAAPMNDGSMLSGFGSLRGSDGVLQQPGLGDAGNGTTTFLGTSARGNRFAILADNSGSMQGAPMAFLKTEILGTLTRARGSSQFYVTFFSSKVEAQPLKRWTVNRNDINAVSAWVKGVETGSGTVPITGFEHVLRLKPPPDVVYFMTDGEFDPREVEQIRTLNQSLRPPAVIHTVALGGRQGENELKLIAKQAKGTYRFVAGPAKQ